MRLAALCLALTAGAASAQDLRGEIVDLLRARDCAMEVGAVAEVFGVMGREAGDVAEAVDGLVAAGSADLLAGRLMLDPALCSPDPEGRRVPPLPWIEERLAAAPGCRLPRDALAREAEAARIPAGDFERAAGDLIALGRLRGEGAELRLSPDLCAPGAPRDRQLDRVLSVGRDSTRALLGLVALDRGCRLPLADREALLADLADDAAERLFLGRRLSDEAGEALRLRLGDALDDPGPAFRVEGAWLVARYCVP